MASISGINIPENTAGVNNNHPYQYTNSWSETLPINQPPIEPLPPVILFSNTPYQPKTTPEAHTISTYSTGTGIATSESKSVPLFNASLLNNSAAQSVPLFPPANFQTVVPELEQIVPQPITDSGSSIPLFASIGSAVEIEPAQTVPLYAEAPPAKPAPAIPLYSPGDLPPKSGINQSPPTGTI